MPISRCSTKRPARRTGRRRQQQCHQADTGNTSVRITEPIRPGAAPALSLDKIGGRIGSTARRVYQQRHQAGLAAAAHGDGGEPGRHLSEAPSAGAVLTGVGCRLSTMPTTVRCGATHRDPNQAPAGPGHQVQPRGTDARSPPPARCRPYRGHQRPRRAQTVTGRRRRPPGHDCCHGQPPGGGTARMSDTALLQPNGVADAGRLYLRLLPGAGAPVRNRPAARRGRDNRQRTGPRAVNTAAIDPAAGIERACRLCRAGTSPPRPAAYGERDLADHQPARDANNRPAAARFPSFTLRGHRCRRRTGVESAASRQLPRASAGKNNLITPVWAKSTKNGICMPDSIMRAAENRPHRWRAPPARWRYRR